MRIAKVQRVNMRKINLEQKTTHHYNLEFVKSKKANNKNVISRTFNKEGIKVKKAAGAGANFISKNYCPNQQNAAAAEKKTIELIYGFPTGEREVPRPFLPIQPPVKSFPIYIRSDKRGKG